jgi:hypothetical protein
VVHDEPLVRLVEVLLNGGLLIGGEIADPALGTSQGSPLSPFLANLYLVPFDRAVEAAGFEMVRYGDVLCINTLSRGEAEQAHDVVVQALARVRLALNRAKAGVWPRSARVSIPDPAMPSGCSNCSVAPSTFSFAT